MYNALIEAGQIIDEMFEFGIKSHRVRVNEETQYIIAELQAACHWYPGMLEWSVLGSVNSGVCFFTLHNKFSGPDTGGPDGGEVIRIDFKAKKRLTEAA